MSNRRNGQGVPLKNSCVVITGASSGIGRALALALGRKGARLVLASRRLDPLQETADACASVDAGRIPLAVSTDVRDEADVKHLVDAATEKMGRIDILINNAGTCVYGSASRMTPDDFHSMLRVHLFGPYYTMRAVIPQMRRQRSGLIVNVASIAALYGVPYLSFYGAAKAAQVALSQSFRSELHGSGVRIMTVSPGNTATPLFLTEKKVGGARRPCGPYQPAEAVAEAIVWAIENGGRDLVLTAEGKLLNVMRSLWPGLVQFVFNRMAERLQEDYSHA